MRKKDKTGKIGCYLSLLWLVAVVLLIAGEVQCIYKAINSDWEPIGKREIIYTASAVCGLGAIVGWFDIPDGKYERKE